MVVEMLDLVDKNDNVIGQIERGEYFKKGLNNTRVINIFIKTSKHKIMIPLRSSNRRIFPNCYDFSVGGFVMSGETYEQAAYRELEEEMGIKDVSLEEIGYFHPNDINTASYSKLYKLVYDGELNYDKDGISQINYFTKNEILQMLIDTPKKFKRDFLELFTWASDKELI